MKLIIKNDYNEMCTWAANHIADAINNHKADRPFILGLPTGSCVNAILAITVLVGGLSSGITVALISPVLAFLLGIAPQILTVPAIMAGNTVYVVLLYIIAGNSKNLVRKVVAWLVAAAAKFATLYAIVVGLICGVLADGLLSAGTLKEPMLKALQK